MHLKPSCIKTFLRSSVFFLGIVFNLMIFSKITDTLETIFLTLVLSVFVALPWVVRNQASLKIKNGFLIGMRHKIPVIYLEEIEYYTHYQTMHMRTPVLVVDVYFKAGKEEIVISKFRYSSNELDDFVNECLRLNPEIKIVETNSEGKRE